MATGRPTKFTQALAARICRRIAQGESVRAIVKDEKMPSASTIFRWLLDEKHKLFWEQYEKARAVQAELMFDELLEIADDGTNDYVQQVNARRGGLSQEEDGEEDEDDVSYVTRLNPENIQRSRLRVDTRKWYLSKVLPKKFGDKQVHIGGDDDDPPIKVDISGPLKKVYGGTGELPKNS